MNTSLKDTKALPLPSCIGYVEDATLPRCCFLYIAPPKLTTLVTLSSLISDDFDPTRTPPLEHRLELARVLAAALFRSHLTAWLHKGLRSENVVYLRAPQDEAAPQDEIDSPGGDGSDTGGPDGGSAGGTADKDFEFVTCPTLIGFDYSRPDRADQRSERIQSHGGSAGIDLYVHPDYQQPMTAVKATTIASTQTTENKNGDDARFKRSYDIYALGLLLIEVALWQPICSFYKKSYDAAKLYGVLREVAEADLGHVVGTKYQDVVKACLDWEEAIKGLREGKRGAKEGQDVKGEDDEASEDEKVDPFLSLVMGPLFERP